MDMKVGIIGGGIIGVTTGVVLAEAGHEITILSRDPFPKTTSYAAAAMSYPTYIEDSERVVGWFMATNERLKALMPDTEYGLSWVDWYRCSKHQTCEAPSWMGALEQARVLEPGGAPYGNQSGIYARIIHIDVDRYFPRLLADFQERGGVYLEKTVTDFESIAGDYDVLIHCTGVYGGALTGDENVSPARGQVVLVRNPGVRAYYVTMDSFNYIYPRGDVCVLGGSLEPGNWAMESDNALTARILAWAAETDPRFQGAEVVDVRVGLRPGRPLVRLEKEILKSGIPVIHNYGHGGAGYTMSWGCAFDVLKMVEAV